MSSKVNILHVNLKTTWGRIQEQQERFDQDIMVFEHQHQGQYNENIMGQYTCSLVRDITYKHEVKSHGDYF